LGDLFFKLMQASCCRGELVAVFFFGSLQSFNLAPKLGRDRQILM